MVSWIDLWQKGVSESDFRWSTDVHTHLLPGVDDGVAAVSIAHNALSALASCGVRRLFLTPHVAMEWPRNSPEALRRHFDSFRAVCPEQIELRLSAEYMLDEGFLPKIREEALTLDGVHMLVETSCIGASSHFEELLFQVELEGYRSVLAHPERYLYMTPDDYCRLKRRGCKFQLNLLSLAGKYGCRVAQRGAFLLEAGLYDFIGSDTHSVRDALAISRLKLSSGFRSSLQVLEAGNERLWEKSI